MHELPCVIKKTNTPTIHILGATVIEVYSYSYTIHFHIYINIQSKRNKNSSVTLVSTPGELSHAHIIT